MGKRSSYEVSKSILFTIAEGKTKYSKIQRHTRTNYDTVTMHCEEFEKYGLVEIKKTEKDPTNGKPSYDAVLTPAGKEAVKRMKKS